MTLQLPTIVIVPDALRDGINAEIDRALGGRQIAADEREDIYKQMLRYFADFGRVPSITLTENKEEVHP